MIGVEGRRYRAHPEHRLKDTIRKDLQSCWLSEEDAQDMIRLSRNGGHMHPIVCSDSVVISQRDTASITLTHGDWS